MNFGSTLTRGIAVVGFLAMVAILVFHFALPVEKGIQVYIERIPDGKEIKLKEDLELIPFTNFAFIVDFNSQVRSSTVAQTGVWRGEIEVEGIGYNVYVLVKQGREAFSIYDEFGNVKTDYYFPTQIEILDEERILVSAEEGNFPENSRIVLVVQSEMLSISYGIYGRGGGCRREIITGDLALALDIDQDGVLNEEDFAPNIKNNYIYAGGVVLTAAFTGAGFVFIRNRKKQKEYLAKIREYRAKIEQWKREGYDVSELEETLK